MHNLTGSRILFVIARGDAFGGSSLHVMDMAARLSDDGHHSKILIGGDESMEVPRRFAERGVDFQCIPTMSREIHPANDLRALIGLRAAAKNFSPDLVSVHASKGGALGRIACLGLGVPVIYTPHCWSFCDGFPKADFYRRVEKWLAPLATRVIAVCEDERLLGLKKGVGRAEQTIAIHNGVRPSIESDRFLREPRPDNQPLRLIMVSRFEEQKDQPLLLKALATLDDSRDWTLSLIGEGPRRAECETLAEALGLSKRVAFLGYQADVQRQLLDHDVFLLTTHWEGFPRSILEAMSASLPIVTSDVGGSSEAVEEGRSGHMIPHGDESRLAEVLDRLISDRERCASMGRAARRRFDERFSFEIMYARYLELYGQLLGDGNRLMAPRRRPISLPTLPQQEWTPQQVHTRDL